MGHGKFILTGVACAKQMVSRFDYLLVHHEVVEMSLGGVFGLLNHLEKVTFSACTTTLGAI